MRFISRPLQAWPRPVTKNRKRSSYSLSYDRTLRHLERELDAIGLRSDVVIQMDIREGDTRQDGLPYADVRPATPRVAISFTCKHGPLTYYCDRFFDWQSNVRAIGLGLERLRLVEETGIVSRGEQYTGFKALPSGIELGPETMTVEEAARVIVLMASPVMVPDVLLNNVALAITQTQNGGKAIFDARYREAVKRHHPDAGGERAKWDRLQTAAAVLEKFFAGGTS